MARQNLNLGTIANDGKGDTLRDAGQKINQNFQELYKSLFGDSIAGNSTLVFGNNIITFEGSAVDNYETDLTITNPTADRTITLPDATGIVLLDTATQTLTNKSLTSAALTTPSIVSGLYEYTIQPSALGGNVTATLPLLISNDTFVFANQTQTLANKTLSAPALNNPKLSVNLYDSNNNVILATSKVGSAVNYVAISNAINYSSPGVAAAGTNTDISLNLSAKGTGAVSVQNRFNLKTETLTNNATASISVPTTILNASSPLLISLPNGITPGDVKKFVNINSGTATVTPALFPRGTSFTLKQYAAVETIWASTGWYLVGVEANDANNKIFIS